METGRSSAARNLVVCCDGTNNTITGGVEDTNVLKLYAYLRKHTAGTATTLYYDPGVGSPDSAPPTDLVDLLKRRVERVAGLASGRGVYDNIEQAYRFLMLQWQGPQDRIFCFGFSRGAFTARCVVGMVNMFGLLRPEHEPLLPTLVRIYFSQPPEEEQRYGAKRWRRALARWLHQGLARPDKAAAEALHGSEETAAVGRRSLAEQVQLNFSRPAGVHWVGVWDTVESVGMPLLFSRDNPSTATFRDKPRIGNVRHALALDEHRLPFLPRLYDSPSEDAVDGRTIRQFWFPGVHCDVGGSYRVAESGLADASLAWMINEVAGELGVPPLTTLPTGGAPRYDDLGMPRQAAVFPSREPLRHDALWDTPVWALAGMTMRDMTTRRVVTNGEMRRRAETARGGAAPAPLGIEVDAKAHGPARLDGPSVWDSRRKAWPVALAVVVALAALYASGSNLLDRSASDDSCSRLPPWQAAPAAASAFALQQLGSLPFVRLPDGISPCEPPAAHGLRDAAIWQRTLQRSPAWAMCWDLLLVAALGYLIARVASRSFTFHAGFRRPGQPLPWWRFVGLLPALAVFADAGEDVATLLAIWLHRLGSEGLSTLGLMLLVGPLSALKLLGYLGCLVAFLPTRLILAVWPTQRVGKVGRTRPASPAERS